MNRIHGAEKRAKVPFSGHSGQFPHSTGMKRLLLFAAIAGLLASLTSCGSMGRTFGSIGRTFGNASGQSTPVIR